MKGLFILFHYSTKSSASGGQNIRFINGLIENRGDIDIVTIGKDPKLSNRNIIEIKATPTSRLNSLILRVFPDLVNIPDLEIVFWTRKVIKTIESKIDIQNYDWIHTTGSPQSVHLIGKFIKKKYKLPWVAQFYDPWVDNNFKKLVFKISKKINLKLERQVASNADLIIHTNEIIETVWKQRYPEYQRKLKLLPLCTDPNITPLQKNQKAYPLKIVHAGQIYGPRNLDTLIEAIKILKETEEDIEKKIQFQLIGYISPTEKKKIQNNGFQNVMLVLGKMQYNEVLEYYKNADILLLIDNLVELNVFFPSKLCEYFSYQKPIIGIVPIKSTAYNHLKISNHTFVTPDNPMKLSKIIQRYMHDYDFSEQKFDKEYFRNFLPNKIASDYLKFINELK
jgi:glycosyltransferase involved in cell wall biosynthesis